jgi:3-methyladenine DNA glycosylase AlkD
MTLQEALSALEDYGTEQNRNIYARHGVTGDSFGVSYANQKTLKKQIKKDHDLALKLWATGNHDARVLATMIADPKQADDDLLDAWAEDLDNYVLTDALTGFVAQTSLLQEKMRAWMESNDEWKGRAGWSLLAHLATKDKDLPDAFFEPFLPVIERDIHAGKNKTKDAMNNALIAIGVRSEALETQAIAVAERIGTVEVDHGETSCKTPPAAPYIQKTRARKKGRLKRET